MKSKQLRYFFGIVLASTFMLATYWRHIFKDMNSILPGDNADSRYTTSLYERWYLFFQGKLGITENFFFYPVSNSMSYSDAYLIQGLIHSAFRFFGLDIINAWLFATLSVHALGCIASILIAHRLKLNLFLSFILVVFWNFNSVIWVQRGHLQNIAYPLIGFCIWLSILQYQTQDLKKRKLYLAVNLNMAIVVGLSASYILVFTVLFASLYVMIYSIWRISTDLREKGRGRRSLLTSSFTHSLKFLNNHMKKYIWSYVSSIPVIYLFAYTYVLSAANVTTRSPAEASFYSPTFSELIEVPPTNVVFGSIIERLFAGSFPATGERFMGYTISFLALFITVCFLVVKKSNMHVTNKLHTYTFIGLCFFTIILAEVIVLRDARGFNLWYLSGARLPFFEAIRGMSRIHQAIYMFGGLLIVVGIESLRKVRQFPVTSESPMHKKQRVNYVRNKYSFLQKVLKNRLIGTLLALLIFGFEVSTYYGTWSKAEFQTIKLSNEPYLRTNCEAFILLPDKEDFVNRAWYLWLIDAQILATEIQVPTISGYSGGQPLNYSLDYSSWDNLNNSWPKYANYLGLERLCSVTRDNLEPSKWTASRA